jgi:hypothetical protein
LNLSKLCNWCLFEILCSFTASVNVTAVFKATEANNLESKLYSISPFLNWVFNFEYFEAHAGLFGIALKNLNVMYAEATVKSDRDLILGQIANANNGNSRLLLNCEQNIRALSDASQKIQKTIFEGACKQIDVDFYGRRNFIYNSMIFNVQIFAICLLAFIIGFVLIFFHGADIFFPLSVPLSIVGAEIILLFYFGGVNSVCL